jgi:GTPase SAR1 family protein
MTNPTPRVGITLGYKRNMGNYETLNMDFYVEDSAREGENVNDTFERVFKYVEKKLLTKLTDVEEELKDGK